MVKAGRSPPASDRPILPPVPFLPGHAASAIFPGRQGRDPFHGSYPHCSTRRQSSGSMSLITFSHLRIACPGQKVCMGHLCAQDLPHRVGAVSQAGLIGRMSILVDELTIRRVDHSLLVVPIGENGITHFPFSAFQHILSPDCFCEQRF